MATKEAGFRTWTQCGGATALAPWTFVIVGTVILIAVVLDQVVHMMQASRQLRKAASRLAASEPA